MDIYGCILFLILGVWTPLADFSCVHRDYGLGGTVCVCNATYCDYLDPIKKAKFPSVNVYTSNLNGLRFQKTTLAFKNGSSEEAHDVPIDINITRSKTFQKVFGFGGAFTDATGINLESLSDDAKEHLMRSYFAKEGIEYNLCRIPIGGTDFSTEAYSYDDGEPDPGLKKFALNHADYNYKIPYIKAAQNLSDDRLQFFASAWTAPTWMKTNEKYVGGTIKPEMYQTWAKYYVKFFDEYKKHEINFWGVTTGNEPSLAKFPLATMAQISSVGWTSHTLAAWVAEALGPVLHKSGYADVNIMALDDQRYYLSWFMDFVFKNEAAKKYINGTAVHWYWDSIFPASFLRKLHDKHPDKFILATEACKGFFLSRGVKLGSWSRGEDYAQDIIEDMNNWVTGWVDWNMALNTTGGPTFINNIVDSPIVVNGTADEFYKQPMYYALGHFSKFVPRNSVRIDSSQSKKVWSIAFKRPDKGVVVIILNRRKTDQNITIGDDSKGILSLNVTAHSLTSLVYW